MLLAKSGRSPTNPGEWEGVFDIVVPNTFSRRRPYLNLLKHIHSFQRLILLLLCSYFWLTNCVYPGSLARGHVENHAAHAPQVTHSNASYNGYWPNSRCSESIRKYTQGEKHLYSEPPPSIHPLSQRCLSHMQHGRIILGWMDQIKSDRPDDGPADFIVSRWRRTMIGVTSVSEWGSHSGEEKDAL